MHSFVLSITMLFYLLTLAACAVSDQDLQTEQENGAVTSLLDVDSGVESNNEQVRQVRQFFGYYGRPIYGSYYGGYGYPYYGGYGYGRPYYGGYYRPYYGVYGGFYG